MEHGGIMVGRESSRETSRETSRESSRESSMKIVGGCRNKGQ